jgi:hypothetical protein
MIAVSLQVACLLQIWTCFAAARSAFAVGAGDGCWRKKDVVVVVTVVVDEGT